MSYWQLALWIGVPFLISKARAYFKKGPGRPTRPWSKWDTYSSLFLGLVGLIQLALCTRRQPNFLGELSVHPEAPSFVVRNNFRAYMYRQYPTWREGSPNTELTLPPEQSRVSDLEKLYDSLKSADQRKSYLRYGHDAHTQCSWCSDPKDYLAFVMPSVMSSYAFMLGCLGVGTLTWRKALWRTYGTIAIAIIFLVELYMISLHEPTFVDKNGVSSSLFNGCFVMRHVAFAALALMAAAINKKDEWTDEDLLKDILAKNQVMYNRSQAYRLARAATLGDTGMRRKFMEYYKEREAVNDAVNRDLEYKEMREKALQSYDLEKLMEDAQHLSGQIVQSAIDEGLIERIDVTQAPPDISPAATSLPNGTTTVVREEPAVRSTRDK
ncbi:hypothetical protein PhCBS80983_g03857 [Powellomyces hirtus]|uniref:Uncharacterized protein n=1 Tax=Powellomyces hirtus TaxID=109895 RepID=A0A507E0N9_9FUNG|nr:hypothetical protein PhCBS80983_g03857 [Powellomyces hirtus]